MEEVPGLKSRMKLKSAVNKVIATRRFLTQVKLEESGREPGIDPRRVELPDLKQKVVVQVVDWCRNQAQFSVLTNEDVKGFLERPRPAWARRWMHVNGRSWDVIKPIALAYNLHPLSLEDMLHHGNRSTRSKVDYYKQHLFVSLAAHKTFASDFEDDLQDPAKNFSSSYGEPLQKKDEEFLTETPISPNNPTAMTHERYNTALFWAFMRLASNGILPAGPRRTLSSNAAQFPHREENESQRKKEKEHVVVRETVDRLTKDHKIHIRVEQLSIFLLRDNTILSFTQDPGFHFRFSKIFDRIHSQSDIIRESEDVSFVLQALLDVVADGGLEIVDEFRAEIEKLEARVLTRPTMGDVRHLHILSAQLILLRSTLEPFQHLLQSIRTQDEAKSAASLSIRLDSSGDVQKRAVGFVSNEAKVYLGDVMDHIESVMSSLDLFANLTENLIGYTFNDLSYSSNSYMQGLSVMSVVFLPLTFISGFFGMNFVIFPAALDPVKGNVTYFWRIAIPVTIFSVLIFSWHYILELYLTARSQFEKLRVRYVKAKTH